MIVRFWIRFCNGKDDGREDAKSDSEDRSYFGKRAREERQRIAAAQTEWASEAHASMASYYDEMAQQTAEMRPELKADRQLPGCQRLWSAADRLGLGGKRTL